MSEPVRRGAPRRGPVATGGTGRHGEPEHRGEPGRRTGLGSGRSLSDLLDRVVDSGAVVTGDVIIGLAGVDLIRLDLRLLLVGAQSAIEAGAGAGLRPYPAPDRDSEACVVEGAVVHDDVDQDVDGDQDSYADQDAAEGAGGAGGHDRDLGGTADGRRYGPGAEP